MIDITVSNPETTELLADRRLYLTADDQPCEADDPRRASLLIAQGLRLPHAAAERYGITQGKDGRLALPGAEAEPEPEEEQKPANTEPEAEGKPEKPASRKPAK